MARPRITLAEEQWALNLKHEIRNSKQFEAPQQNTELSRICSFGFTIVPLQGTLPAKLPKYKIQTISF